MGWETSGRAARLPANWAAIRVRVLNRDAWLCQVRYDGCLRMASQVDHITPGDDHDEANLQSICTRCHELKTARDSVQARRNIAARGRRAPEQHPGAAPGG